MSAYIVAEIEVHDPDHYADYVRQVPAFIARYGGRYVVRGGNVAALEGNWHPKRFVVLEFPSTERAREFLSDPGYREIAAIRWASATTNLILAEGYEG